MSQRERFEHWFSAQTPFKSLERTRDMDYKFMAAYTSWVSWKSAVKSEREIDLTQPLLQRERFERWFLGELPLKTILERDEEGDYKLISARTNWTSWQAAIREDRECAITQPFLL